MTFHPPSIQKTSQKHKPEPQKENILYNMCRNPEKIAERCLF